MIPRSSRRNVLIGIGAAMCATPATAFAWQPITASDAGIAPDLGDRIDAAHRKGELPGLHGLVIARRGRLALERYYPGVDETWGRPLGNVEFGPETLHDLRSVTKSLVGLLYGMALADGKVPPPDAVLVDQFPEYPDLAGDPARRRLAVSHVLSMTLGLEWNENLEASIRPAVAIDEHTRYGLHWYLGKVPVTARSGQRLEPWVGAFGNGGQRLLVVSGLELVVAITAGNYNQPDQRQMPLTLVRDIVLPSLTVD